MAEEKTLPGMDGGRAIIIHLVLSTTTSTVSSSVVGCDARSDKQAGSFDVYSRNCAHKLCVGGCLLSVGGWKDYRTYMYTLVHTSFSDFTLYARVSIRTDAHHGRIPHLPGRGMRMRKINNVNGQLLLFQLCHHRPLYWSFQDAPGQHHHPPLSVAEQTIGQRFVYKL